MKNNDVRKQFQELMKFIENRMRDIAIEISEEELEKLETLVAKLRMVWNSYHYYSLNKFM